MIGHWLEDPGKETDSNPQLSAALSGNGFAFMLTVPISCTKEQPSHEKEMLLSKAFLFIEAEEPNFPHFHFTSSFFSLPSLPPAFVPSSTYFPLKTTFKNTFIQKILFNKFSLMNFGKAIYVQSTQ